MLEAYPGGNYRAVDDAQQQPPLVFPVVDFMELFGSKQMAIITAATVGSPGYDWQVSALWNRMTAGQNVRYDNPLVAQGMAVLVAKGLLSQAEADIIIGGTAINTV
jgi:hypothetical protein